MRLLSKLSFLILFVGVAFTSCDRDNIDQTITPSVEFEPEVVVVNNLITALTTTETDGLELGCLYIEYPFELLLEDGSTVEVFDLEGFETAADQEPPFQAVDFVYPLTVSTDEGESFVVNGGEELGVLFGSCIPEEGWDDTSTSNGGYTIPAFLFEELCFDLVYPVDVADADETPYTANSEAELIDLLATTANLSFVLPITVVDEAGTEVMIESVAGFYDLYYSCDGVTPPGTEGGIVIDFSDLDSANCDFESLAIEYPYTVLTDGGESITVENENQEAALILGDEEYTIQYPFNLVDADGTVTTINDEMQFIELILPCLVVIEEPETCNTPAHVLLYFNQSFCGTVVYNNQLIAEGVTYEITSFDDYINLYGMYQNQIDAIDIIYPISVTTPEGTVLTFNSDEEVCAFVDACG